jgi:hypothetical protein
MTEESRHRIYQKLEQLFGPGDAALFMSQLRIVGSAELATRHDLEALGSSLRGEIADLRGEFGVLRGEFGELRGEFGELRGEVRGEIGGLRGEMQAGIATLDASITERMRTQLMAIIGLNVTLFVGAIGSSFAIVQLA